jgi:translocation and assembly module TamA
VSFAETMSGHKDAACCAPNRMRTAFGFFLACALLAFSPLSFASLNIEIVGVTEPLEINVRAFLSVTRYAERTDLTAETISRLERRIPAEVRSALQPLGYYSPTVNYVTQRDGDSWKIRIEIDAGRAVRLSEVDVRIEGEGQTDAALNAVLERRDLKPGSRLDHGVYEKVKAELLRVALSEGYLDARLKQNDLLIDPIDRRANVTIVLQSGGRYRFGTIDVHQPVLHEEKARRLLRMQPGDPYTVDAMLETQYVFDDSQYFTNVELEPGEPDEESRSVPLTVRADRNKRNGYRVSGGYGTDTRVRGKLGWDTRYINRHGHRSQIELIGSSIVQEATAKYIVPVMDIALEKVEFSITSNREELGDIDSRRNEFGVGLTQALGSWQRVTFLRFANETNESLAVTETESTVPEETFLILPGISFATLPPSLLERQPRRYSLYAVLTGSPESLGSDTSFLQLYVQGERVFDLSTRWHLRLRGQAGVTWSDEFSFLPASHRFFAGGDNSVRGFGLNELSPLDSLTGARIGGRHLLVGSVEVERDLPRNFGVAVFYDMGNAFDDFSDPLEYSAGLGVRYRLASVASIGVDVAQALSDTSRSPRLHLRLTTLF